jgi:hypothetical protein
MTPLRPHSNPEVQSMNIFYMAFLGTVLLRALEIPIGRFMERRHLRKARRKLIKAVGKRKARLAFDTTDNDCHDWRTAWKSSAISTA